MKAIQAIVGGILLFAGFQSQGFALTTDYQTLISAYDNATVAAQVSDFEGTQKSCVAVKASTVDVVKIDYAVKCGKVAIPATPDQDIPAVPAKDIPAAGPLLPAQHIPAQPARHIPGTAEVCAPGSNLLLLGADWIKTATTKQLSVFSEQTVGSDFVIAVAKNDQQIYADIGENVKFMLRSANGYFPFVISNNGSIVYAGYCY